MQLKYFYWFLLLLVFPMLAFAQLQEKNSLEEPLPAHPAMVQESQFGVRFGYQLQFPSKNQVSINNFSFFEAGHYLGYGAYFNVFVTDNIQFSPFFGLEHGFWPKSEGYSRDCLADSFPTFMAVKDSLPGRDFRFYNLTFEPAFKFYSRKRGVFFKVQPMFSYNIQRKVEQYNHSCGVLPQSQFVDYETNAFRNMSRFTFSLGFGIVKEVWVNEKAGIALEPGFKVMLSRLLAINDENPNGPNFSLYPWGFYLNLSFFR